MKTNRFFAMMISAVMTTAVAATAIMNAFAAGPAGGYTGWSTPYELSDKITEEDVENSIYKPTMSLSRIEIPINEAKENPVQTIELTVEGAKKAYCSTGIHIGFDDRLEVVCDVENDEVTPHVEAGPAAKSLMRDEPTFWAEENTVFLATMGKTNGGSSGVLWTVEVRLPENVKVGNVYPIEVLYQKTDSADDMFRNKAADEVGLAMEAWLFTRGIEQGYIKITDEVIPEVPELKEDDYLGDIDGNSQVNSSDASRILEVYGQIQTGQDTGLTDAQKLAADIDKNGKIDACDATIVLSYYAYLSTGGRLPITQYLAECF